MKSCEVNREPMDSNVVTIVEKREFRGLVRIISNAPFLHHTQYIPYFCSHYSRSDTIIEKKRLPSPILIGSPESNETPERMDLKSILKRICAQENESERKVQSYSF